MSTEKNIKPRRINPNKIPDEILNNESLKRDIELLLPENYNFEIFKTIARIRYLKAKIVILQMPDGIVLFFNALKMILEKHAYENEDLIVDIIEDISYGACCIDDQGAIKKKGDLLIHYGHSCLVPVEDISTFYVFVDIKVDVKHFFDAIYANFSPGTTMIIVATIQFVTTLQSIKEELSKTFNVIIPKIAPLSPGEILGCTAPRINDENVECIVYLGDGRFHLESIMIANPSLPAYQYNPYNKIITREYYDHDEMRKMRWEAIEKARSAKTIGIIHGTLGRQGSVKVLNKFIDLLKARNMKYHIIPMSEFQPDDIDSYSHCDAFFQNACPRLSIDWGASFKKPVLNPYEAAVMLEVAAWLPGGRYPTDFYAYESLGEWTPNYRHPSEFKVRKPRKHVVVGGSKLPSEMKQLSIENGDNETTKTTCDHEWSKCTNCSCFSNLKE